MKTQIQILTLASLAFALPAAADVFVLKDGSRVEGSILLQAGDSYVIEVQVTKSIKDERTIAKADVANIEREQPDLIAFESISKLIPTPDFLSSEEYDRRISEVKSFLQTYPTTKKKKEAQSILDRLIQEAVVVSAGGVKSGLTLLKVEDYKADAYEMDARKLEAKIRAAASRGDSVSALRAFSELEKDYKSTVVYTGLKPYMRKVLKNYKAQTLPLQEGFAAAEKAQKTGLDQMAPIDRANAEAGLAEEKAAIEARYQQEKSDKQVWVTTSPLHKASLDDTIRAIDLMQTALDTPDAKEQKDGGELYRQAWSAVRNNQDAKAAQPVIADAKAAAIPPRYIAMIEGAAKTSGTP